MMRLLTIALFMLLYQATIAEVVGMDAIDLFNKGNEAYQKEEFESAIEYYNAVSEQNFESGELYYNLGNAHYKIGNIGEAILNYERALKIEPDNEDAIFNLKIANLKVTDRIDPLKEAFVVQWIKMLLTSRSANGWTWFAIISIWVAFGFGVLLIFINSTLVKRLCFVGIVASLFFALVFIGASLWQYNYQKTATDGIIMVVNTYVKSAPNETSVDLFILREGVKVRLMNQSENWQQIKVIDDQGDKLGWIPIEDVTPI